MQPRLAAILPPPLCLGLALAGLVGLSGPFGPAGPALAQATGGGAPTVSIAAAYTEAVTEETVFIGRGEAVDTVDLVARVEGFLRDIAVADGGQVAQGDVLFSIEPEQYEATVAARQADVTRAEANRDLAQIELSRAQQLVERGSTPQSQLDIAEANESVSEAEVRSAQAALRNAELELSYTTLAAPFPGRIGRLQRSVGDLVGPGTGPLATLVREMPIYVSFALGERQLADIMQESLAEGRAADASPVALDVLVTLPNGTPLDEVGRIVFGDNRIDPATGTLTVRAQFDNADGLILDGAFVSVAIAGAEPVDRLLVPQAAIQRDQRGEFVLVVGPDNIVEQRYIETAQRLGAAAVVTSGLREGESVIVEGLQRVRPGVPVDTVLAGTEG